MLSSAITSVSGASKVFTMSLITYSNQAKMKILKVPKKIIKLYGAVSVQCCLSMVNNLSKIINYYNNKYKKPSDPKANFIKLSAPSIFISSAEDPHLNLIIAWPPADSDPLEGLNESEIKGLNNQQKYQSSGYGYYAIQSTKPQTLGYGLNDSPIGLAAWIIEKFHAWTDDENDKLILDLDEVLALSLIHI